MIFLCLLAVLLYALCWGVYGVYVAGRGYYLEYRVMIDDFEARKSLQTKFQDPKFKEFTNILLLGLDDGDPENSLAGRRADAIFVVSINNTNGFLHLLSIPRDTKANIPGRAAEENINQSYYYGGTQLAVRTVENLLQIPLHHYIVLDMRAFTEIVDVLGGIYLYVEHDMDYEDPYAQLAIHLKKGYQYLSGAEAVQYMRYRSDELGDVGRVQRQQKFLKALYGEVLKVDTIAKLPAVLEIVNRRVTTSLAALDTAHVAKSLSDCRAEAIRAEMLPGAAQEEKGETYWRMDLVKTQQLLDEAFKNENLLAPKDGAGS